MSSIFDASTARAVALLSLLGGCGEAPLQDGRVDALSASGSTEAHVSFEGGVKRGQNALLVELTPLDAEGVARLESVEALMAVHGHLAHVAHISMTEAGFRAAPLELSMSGRWQVELGLRSDAGADVVSFPVDVP